MKFLQMLWFFSGGDKPRRIVIAPTKSFHYPELGDRLILCDLFRMPERISCEREKSGKGLMFSKDYHPPCIILEGGEDMAAMNWPTNTVKRDFYSLNFQKVTCLGRTQNVYWTGAWHGHAGSNDINMPWSFAQEDLTFLRESKRGVLPSNRSYVVAHWRRGDQLQTRCRGVDHSINCAPNAEAFVSALEGLSRRYSLQGMPLYVATNEEKPSNIKVLRDAGFKIQQDFFRRRKGRTATAKNTTSLDLFLLDLMLMCEARVLLQWGYSSAHVLTSQCRSRRSDLVTIVDGAAIKIK